MRETKNIDFGKLLGFDTVSDRIEGRFDFRDETIGTKLGAKVGAEDAPDPSANHTETAAKPS